MLQTSIRNQATPSRESASTAGIKSHSSDTLKAFDSTVVVEEAWVRELEVPVWEVGVGELEVLVQAVVVELVVEVLETETLAEVGQSKAILSPNLC